MEQIDKINRLLTLSYKHNMFSDYEEHIIYNFKVKKFEKFDIVFMYYENEYGDKTIVGDFYLNKKIMKK